MERQETENHDRFKYNKESQSFIIPTGHPFASKIHRLSCISAWEHERGLPFLFIVKVILSSILTEKNCKHNSYNLKLENKREKNQVSPKEMMTVNLYAI